MLTANLLSLTKMHKNTRRLLHPSAGILASKKWEWAVLITAKNAKKSRRTIESLGGDHRKSHIGRAASDPAVLLVSGGFAWQSFFEAGAVLSGGQNWELR
jgi:hypothetical protein